MSEPNSLISTTTNSLSFGATRDEHKLKLNGRVFTNKEVWLRELIIKMRNHGSEFGTIVAGMLLGEDAYVNITAETPDKENPLNDEFFLSRIGQKPKRLHPPPQIGPSILEFNSMEPTSKKNTATAEELWNIRCKTHEILVKRWMSDWGDSTWICLTIINSMTTEAWESFILAHPYPYSKLRDKCDNPRDEFEGKNVFKFACQLVSHVKSTCATPAELLIEGVSELYILLQSRNATLEAGSILDATAAIQDKILCVYTAIKEIGPVGSSLFNATVNFAWLMSLDKTKYGDAVKEIQLEIMNDGKKLPQDLNLLSRRIQNYINVNPVAVVRSANSAKQGKGIQTGTKRTSDSASLNAVTPDAKKTKSKSNKTGMVKTLIDEAKAKGRSWSDPKKPAEWLTFNETGVKCDNDSCRGSFKQHLHRTENCKNGTKKTSNEELATGDRKAKEKGGKKKGRTSGGGKDSPASNFSARSHGGSEVKAFNSQYLTDEDQE